MTARARKLSFSFLEGPCPSISLDAADWQKIEDAYRPNHLSAEVRNEFIVATNQMLEFSAFALAARPIKDALKRVEEIESAAAQLLQSLVSESEELLLVDRMVERHFAVVAEKDASFDRFRGSISSLIAACGKTRHEIKTQRSSTELGANDHWKLWVRRLTAIANRHQLPITVRKDRDNNQKWKPSAFVELVTALQEFVPTEYRYRGRKRAHSREALAQAIVAARSEFRLITARDHRH